MNGRRYLSMTFSFESMFEISFDCCTLKVGHLPRNTCVLLLQDYLPLPTQHYTLNTDIPHSHNAVALHIMTASSKMPLSLQLRPREALQALTRKESPMQ